MWLDTNKDLKTWKSQLEKAARHFEYKFLPDFNLAQEKIKAIIFFKN
jgi:hypothetical protein